MDAMFFIAYFVSLGLSEEEASELHHQYYTQYGLALAGLVRNHDVGEVKHFRRLPCVMLNCFPRPFRL
jgi:hypothetical protein